ncbi:hypothetical protein EVAR_59883_1 [Eumeta japonica]|uniref:Uncharacterized protein n=1 Tax=Eumeta variegata TaxID=151549 RepID=A0A4C1XR87_EUMVA|nr:hypothetical protein EVAR_59883_1 [Eumeta japonica]
MMIGSISQPTGNWRVELRARKPGSERRVLIKKCKPQKSRTEPCRCLPERGHRRDSLRRFRRKEYVHP